MNFFFNCSSCNTNFNFQESYCKYCIAKITADQTRVFELIENVTEKRQHNIQLKKAIETHLDQDKTLLDREAKIGLIIGKRAQIAKLREECNRMNNEIDLEQEQIEARKKYLSTRRSQLKRNKVIFEQSDKSECTLLPEKIERLRIDMTDCRLRLELKRRQTVDIVTNYILPIMRSSTEPDNLVIVNIVVNDKKLQKYPKDIVSATLGYVVKLTEMIAYLLGIPLPHKMKFIGSKSTIQQNTDISKQALPLYFNNKTKSRDYQKALYLLGENISFLRFQQGILTTKESHTYFLENLVELLNSPNLGKSGPFNYERTLGTTHSPSSSTIYTTLDTEESKEDWEFIDFLPPQPDQTEDIEQLERILRSDNVFI